MSFNNTRDVLQWKLKYIAAFNKMEELLKEQEIIPKDLPAALRMAAEIAEKAQALQIENTQQKQIINEMQPKASYYDLILQNNTLMSVTQIAKDYGMSAKKMNSLLHDLGVQHKKAGYGSCMKNISATVIPKARLFLLLMAKIDSILTGRRRDACLFTIC